MNTRMLHNVVLLQMYTLPAEKNVEVRKYTLPDHFHRCFLSLRKFVKSLRAHFHNFLITAILYLQNPRIIPEQVAFEVPESIGINDYNMWTQCRSAFHGQQS